MKNTLEKFLVIQTSFIGDAILASSVLEQLHQHYPASSISILVRKGNESLYKDHPYIDHCWIWDKKNKYRSMGRVIKLIRKEKYDVVINLQRFASSGLITAFSKGKNKIGFKKNPLSFFFNEAYQHTIGNGTHEIERNNQLIAKMTSSTPAKPRLYPSDKQYQKFITYTDKPYFCLAPKSVWKTKELPLEKWVELIQMLPQDALKFLIGGPNDRAYCDQILKLCDTPNVSNRCGEDQLLETAALMEKASMNFVNDSAPLHLASARNAPVTAFFCSTIPGFGFTPTSDQSHIVEINEPLYCRPCGLHGKKECPEGHFKCGYNIQINDAIKL